MNTKVLYLVAFTAGVTIGSAVTSIYLREKYAKKADEEINSMREFYHQKQNELTFRNNDQDDTNKKEDTTIQIKKENMNEYREVITKSDYTAYSKNAELKEDDKDMTDEPYVIPPEEYGDYADYEQIELTYFADGVLTDENNIPVEDIEGTVGPYFADHFGEYEDDSVFVRNDVRRCEYEILADTRNYADVAEDLYR